jgi:hypothetical protein
MKIFKTIAMIALMITVGTATSSAHGGGHGGKGPHGGQMVMTGDWSYMVELLNKEGEVSVYLLDPYERSISNKYTTGTINLQYADSTSETVELTPKGYDGFAVINQKASDFTTCVITLKVNGKSITATFKAVVKIKNSEQDTIIMEDIQH